MSNKLVIKSDHIFTAAPGVNEVIAGVIVVEDNNISYVGPLASCPIDVSQFEIIDAKDQFVCPGFHDSHLHFFPSSVNRSPFNVFCEGRKPEDCLEALKTVEDKRPKDKFMLSYGWYHPLWEEPKLPTKEILDEAYPDRPVCLQSGDAHTLWTNSKGLEKFGITKDSVPPAGGFYQKDENGELTGIIQEQAAMALMPKMMEFSDDEINVAVEQFVRDLNAEGITSVGDLALLGFPGADFVRDDIYERLYDEGKLTVRINMFPTALSDLTRARKLRERFKDHEMIRMPGLKQFFDGVSSTHTAWLKEPYANATSPDDCGAPVKDPAEMRAIVLNANKEGFPVRIHTIGDQAIHVALDIFEESLKVNGPVDGQNGLEHLENFQPDDIMRLKELDVCANCQPPHTVIDTHGIEADLGLERIKYMWPYKTYVDNDIKFSFGTDSPVVDINSRAVIYDAVTRQNPITREPKGGWVPEEKIRPADAIRAYTYGSAIATNNQDRLGTLEPGMRADFVILDKDLLNCDSEEILDAKVLATYLNGQPVYKRES